MVQSFRAFRLALLFILSYVVVNYVFIFYLTHFLPIKLAVFATSPFNGIENLSPVYNSIYLGLYNNFVLVTVVITGTELYSRTMSRRMSEYLKIEYTFIFAVVASYLDSLLSWWATGKPTGGTSIIAFTLLTFLLASCLLDWQLYSSKQYPKDTKSRLRLLTWLVAFVFSGLLSLTYIFGNSSYQAHLAGAAIFYLIVACYIIKNQTARKITQLRDDNERLLGFHISGKPNRSSANSATPSFGRGSTSIRFCTRL